MISDFLLHWKWMLSSAELAISKESIWKNALHKSLINLNLQKENLEKAFIHLFTIRMHHCSLGKPINSHSYKMSGLNCLVFCCVYWFFLRRWNYIKIFVLQEKAVLLPKFFSCRLTSSTSQKYNRSIVILWRTLLRIFGKWLCFWKHVSRRRVKNPSHAALSSITLEKTKYKHQAQASCQKLIVVLLAVQILLIKSTNGKKKLAPNTT